MNRRVIFPNKLLPYLLLAPQTRHHARLLLLARLPGDLPIRLAARIRSGFSSRFVGLDNFRGSSATPLLDSLQVTVVFCLPSPSLALVAALLLAVMADRVVRGKGIYRTLLIWPYAVAPAIAGMLWLFLFNPSMASSRCAARARHPLEPAARTATRQWCWSSGRRLEADQLQLPVLPRRPAGDPEVADRGGSDRRRRPGRRFWTIVFPLLSPTTFFLLVVNTVYAFFDTFGIIHAVTGGGPGKATEILVYKVYNDGFVNLRPRRLVGAVGDPDGDRHRADRRPVPLRRAQVHY